MDSNGIKRNQVDYIGLKWTLVDSVDSCGIGWTQVDSGGLGKIQVEPGGVETTSYLHLKIGGQEKRFIFTFS